MFVQDIPPGLDIRLHAELAKARLDGKTSYVFLSWPEDDYNFGPDIHNLRKAGFKVTTACYEISFQWPTEVSIKWDKLNTKPIKTVTKTVVIPESLWYCIKPDGRVKFTTDKDRAIAWSKEPENTVVEYSQDGQLYSNTTED